MISLENAIEVLLKQIDKLKLKSKRIEHISLWESGGRMLARDISADENVPAFDRSPIDGYALIAEDTFNATATNPVKLKIIDTVAAGFYTEKELTSGTAMQIFTGAPLPKGATCVIKEEEVTETGDEVIINRKLNNGEGIAYKGEDIAIGDFLLPRGTIIKSTHMGILATLGLDYVPVFEKPKIGIFSTGSELVEVHKQLTHGKLRVSNIHTLAEIIREAGATPVNLGIVKDNLVDVIKVYEKAKQLNLPIVISTGGTATGDYDLIKEAMDEISSERLFDKIAVRPGAPAVTSVKDGQLLIGLSGNPAGAAVATYILVYPLISKLIGAYKEIEQFQAKLTSPITRRGGLRGFLWAQYYEENGELYVTPDDNQFCGALKTFSQSNCLVEVPGGKISLGAGQLVKVWKLPS